MNLYRARSICKDRAVLRSTIFAYLCGELQLHGTVSRTNRSKKVQEVNSNDLFSFSTKWEKKLTVLLALLIIPWAGWNRASSRAPSRHGRAAARPAGGSDAAHRGAPCRGWQGSCASTARPSPWPAGPTGTSRPPPFPRTRRTHHGWPLE